MKSSMWLCLIHNVVLCFLLVNFHFEWHSLAWSIFSKELFNACQTAASCEVSKVGNKKNKKKGLTMGHISKNSPMAPASSRRSSIFSWQTRVSFSRCLQSVFAYAISIQHVCWHCIAGVLQSFLIAGFCMKQTHIDSLPMCVSGRCPQTVGWRYRSPLSYSGCWITGESQVEQAGDQLCLLFSLLLQGYFIRAVCGVYDVVLAPEDANWRNLKVFTGLV